MLNHYETTKGFYLQYIVINCFAFIILGIIGAIFPALVVPSPAPEATSVYLKHLTTQAEFDQCLLDAGADKLVVIDFYATWCPPCKMIAPKVVELADELKDTVVMAKVDVDVNKEASESAGVTSMPTFQFYKNSQKLDEFAGADYDKLIAKID